MDKEIFQLLYIKWNDTALTRDGKIWACRMNNKL